MTDLNTLRIFDDTPVKDLREDTLWIDDEAILNEIDRIAAQLVGQLT